MLDIKLVLIYTFISVFWMKGRRAASLWFPAFFSAYIGENSHAYDISCFGRTWLLETRAVLPEQDGQIEICVRKPHYSFPSVNCCFFSCSFGNDIGWLILVRHQLRQWEYERLLSSPSALLPHWGQPGGCKILLSFPGWSTTTTLSQLG